MSRKQIIFTFILGFVFIMTVSGFAQDIRVMEKEAQQKKAVFIEKANREKVQAEKEAIESKKKILSDKTLLLAAIKNITDENNLLEQKKMGQEKDLKNLLLKKENVQFELEKVEGITNELIGFIRINARDLDTIFNQSIQSAIIPDRRNLPASVMGKAKFPGMDDIAKMSDLLFDELHRSGEVRIINAPFVNRAGEEINGDILMLGNFTSTYRLNNETGFLSFSGKSEQFFALSVLPSSSVVKKINRYMDGKSEDVPIDITLGAALRQLTNQLSLLDQIPNGGPIVWPIIGIFIIALLIISERFIYLSRKQMNANNLINKIHEYVSDGKWNLVKNICEQNSNKSVGTVLLAVVNNRKLKREEIENKVQERILGEIPLLERFLSTLGMLAAIAPLLGLLGTVTGMINTFHVITCYGTGDPRMMSGGISEALVTTMIGLAVAIPAMLFHTILTQKVENIIGQMEEKAVVLINTIDKTRDNL